MHLNAKWLCLLSLVPTATAMPYPLGHDRQPVAATMKHPAITQEAAQRPTRPAPPSGQLAVSTEAFLDSMGVVTNVSQGCDPRSYIDPLRYLGIRQARDGTHNVSSEIMLHRATGVRYTIHAGGDLDGLITAAKALASANALSAIEGPNEPNNFPIVYQGKHGGGLDRSWIPVATFQRDLYETVRADSALKHYPVLGPSESGSETDNVGVQFLTIPAGAASVFPAGTRYADYVNVHNYVTSNVNALRNNQAWNAADPTLNAEWDGLYGNHGETWYKHYPGYTRQQLETLPRITTQTGWDSAVNPGGQRTQGTILTNTYLSQFKRGWRYTFIYELRDNEGGGGQQGLYSGSSPKLAATYIHNLTSILSDNAQLEDPGRLAYTIPDQPDTVHDLLLQKSTGQYELIVWDERAQGNDDVTVRFATPQGLINVYDITTGILPVQRLADAKSVHLKLNDHAMILEVSD